jgi:uncharacterized protein YjbI with pentapeptide repeats
VLWEGRSREASPIPIGRRRAPLAGANVFSLKSQRSRVLPPKDARRFLFRRYEPDLPAELEGVPDPVALAAHRDIVITENCLSGVSFENHARGVLHVRASVLSSVSFANAVFDSVTLRDVRLLGCDLSNLEASRLSLARVEIVDCRMTGFRAGEAQCNDVLISQGDQRYSVFRFSRFQSVEFRSCNLSGSDFYGSDLSGSLFCNCDLRGAEMNAVKLNNADLRGSSVDGLRLGAGDIRGAIVDPAQAMIFAQLLEIRIL